jgi:hypothetical protein
MTRATNARIAGASFLLYIVFGLSALAIESPISAAQGIAARLAAIAAEPWRFKVVIAMNLAMFVYAVTLGVTLHALTRDSDADLAVSGLVFRVAEGVLGMVGTSVTIALLWLATSPAAATLDASATHAVGAALVRLMRLSPIIAAFAFTLGSLCFAMAFLRARSIPLWLAWLGVIASALLVVVLPIQAVGGVSGMAANLVWLPMLVFELVLAVRLLAKGEAAVAPGSYFDAGGGAKRLRNARSAAG